MLLYRVTVFFLIYMPWWRRKAGGGNVVELVSAEGVPNHRYSNQQPVGWQPTNPI